MGLIGKRSPPKPPLSPILLFHKILLKNDGTFSYCLSYVGRDKILKVIQYISRLLLWSLAIEKVRNPNSTSKLHKIISQFSITRKIIRLMHFIEPISEVAEFLSCKPEDRPDPRTIKGGYVLSIQHQFGFNAVCKRGCRIGARRD
jgi:hypothetical protein